MGKVSYLKYDFAMLWGCTGVAEGRSVIFKGNEAVAKLKGKTSFFLERHLTKNVTSEGTCTWLFLLSLHTELLIWIDFLGRKIAVRREDRGLSEQLLHCRQGWVWATVLKRACTAVYEHRKWAVCKDSFRRSKAGLLNLVLCLWCD